MKPTFLVISNGYGLIDGKQKYKFQIPPEGWDIGQVDRLFIAACIDYGFDEGLDDEAFINKIVSEAIKNRTKTDKEGANNDISDPEEKLTQPQILVQLANQSCQYFRDQYGSAHALVTFNKDSAQAHDQVLPIERNGKFKKLLSMWYYTHQNGGIVGTQAIGNAVQLLAGIAVFNRPTIELHLRVAWAKKDQELVYDLTNDEFEYVVINGEGWNITRRPSILFKRFNQKPQVTPTRDYPKDIMSKYLDLNQIIDQQQRLLTSVWTVSSYIPNIPHPIDLVHGEKGAAKTTYCRFEKRLIDPDTVELLTIPKDKNEFVQQLYHTYLAIYDNVKTIPYWFSDEVCKAVTGVGNMKRALYTDDDDVVYSYMRCIMVNGINNVLTEPDALDRSVMTELARLSGKKRREDARVQEEFEAMRPQLLGCIFDILSKAIAIKSEVVLSEYPRMADFAIWGEAIARAMGYQPLEFIDSYAENIGRQNVEAIESHPLAQSIIKYVAVNGDVSLKTVEEFHKELTAFALSNDIDTQDKWPKRGNALSRKLKLIMSNLREGKGIDIKLEQITQGSNKGSTGIRIEKTSPLSPQLYQPQNRAQQLLEDGRDTGGGNSTSSTIPLLENPENRAQIDTGGDSGDSGDVFRNRKGAFRCLKCTFSTDKITDFNNHAASHGETEVGN